MRFLLSDCNICRQAKRWMRGSTRCGWTVDLPSVRPRSCSRRVVPQGCARRLETCTAHPELPCRHCRSANQTHPPHGRLRGIPTVAVVPHGADEFFAHLRGVRNLSHATIRAYQSDVRLFLENATNPLYE
ncbi:hypothetical protein CH251_13980 [Rhodococcus sp. 06-462-5]|nr:hypothetical protein CH251_13980 [Rhodococcus sp. 06-462-5]